MTRILCLLLLIAALAVCAALLPLALPVLIVVGVVQAVLLFFLIWTAMLHGRDYDENGYLFMVTRQGTVKRLAVSALKNIRASGIRALTLDEGDELVCVLETDGAQKILIATHDGMAVCFDEQDVRPMGRTAVGVRGIKLRPGDYVIGGVLAQLGTTLLAITENGYGKRTHIEEYIRSGGEPQHRGGFGLKGYQITEKTGKAAGVKVVEEDDSLQEEPVLTDADLVLGIRPEQAINRFLGGLPRRYEEAEGPCKLNACRFTIDTESGRCVQVRRVDLEE